MKKLFALGFAFFATGLSSCSSVDIPFDYEDIIQLDTLDSNPEAGKPINALGRVTAIGEAISEGGLDDPANNGIGNNDRFFVIEDGTSSAIVRVPNHATACRFRLYEMLQIGKYVFIDGTIELSGGGAQGNDAGGVHAILINGLSSIHEPDPIYVISREVADEVINRMELAPLTPLDVINIDLADDDVDLEKYFTYMHRYIGRQFRFTNVRFANDNDAGERIVNSRFATVDSNRSFLAHSTYARLRNNELTDFTAFLIGNQGGNTLRFSILDIIEYRNI